MEVISSRGECFYTGLSIFDVNFAKKGCSEDWPLWRSDGLNFCGICFLGKKALHMQNFTIIRHQVPELCSHLSRKLQMPVPLLLRHSKNFIKQKCFLRKNYPRKHPSQGQKLKNELKQIFFFGTPCTLLLSLVTKHVPTKYLQNIFCNSSVYGLCLAHCMAKCHKVS